MSSFFWITLIMLGVIAVIMVWFRGLWSEMPIVHDDIMTCPNCKNNVVQHRVLYNEYDKKGRRIGTSEGRTCTNCKYHTDFKYDLDNNVVAEFKKADPAKEDYDFKRRNPRKYKPRSKP